MGCGNALAKFLFRILTPLRNRVNRDRITKSIPHESVFKEIH
jgi:hypothetical protein